VYFVCNFAVKEISDEKERIQTIYGLTGRLPPANRDLLERLVFHLTRYCCVIFTRIFVEFIWCQNALCLMSYYC